MRVPEEADEEMAVSMEHPTDRRATGVRRVPVERIVDVCAASAASGSAFQGWSMNVSGRGMSVRATHLPELHAAVVVRFQEHGSEVIAEGEVAWRSETPAGAEFGVRFTALDSRSVQSLKALCQPELLPVLHEPEEPPAEEEHDTEPAPTVSSVKLHIEGLAAPMQARVRQQGGQKLALGSRLDFLRVGRNVEVEEGTAGDRRSARIDDVDVTVDPESQVPELIVSLCYDGPAPAPRAKAERAATSSASSSRVTKSPLPPPSSSERTAASSAPPSRVTKSPLPPASSSERTPGPSPLPSRVATSPLPSSNPRVTASSPPSSRDRFAPILLQRPEESPSKMAVASSPAPTQVEALAERAGSSGLSHTDADIDEAGMGDLSEPDDALTDARLGERYAPRGSGSEPAPPSAARAAADERSSEPGDPSDIEPIEEHGGPSLEIEESANGSDFERLRQRLDGVLGNLSSAARVTGVRCRRLGEAASRSASWVAGQARSAGRSALAAQRASLPLRRTSAPARSLRAGSPRSTRSPSDRAATPARRSPRRVAFAGALVATVALATWLGRGSSQAEAVARPLTPAAAPTALPANEAPAVEQAPTHDAHPRLLVPPDHDEPEDVAEPAGVVAQVPLFGPTSLGPTPARGAERPARAPLEKRALARVAVAEPAFDRAPPAAPRARARTAAAPTEFGSGRLNLPIVYRLRLDQPGTSLRGERTPTGFDVIIAGRKTMESGTAIAKRDPRIAKVSTKNGTDGTRVSFRFRSDIPAYKVRLKQDFVEFFISSKD
jgi:hypothetical protein